MAEMRTTAKRKRPIAWTLKCRAAARKTFTGVLGERCGKPATAADWLGRPVCAECFEWIETARGDARSVVNVLREIYERRTSKSVESRN